MKNNLTLPLRRLRMHTQAAKKKAMLLVFAFFSVFLTGLHAQEKAQQPPGDGCDATCLGNVLNISTGYNQSTGTYNTPLAYESNWTLVGTPISSPVTLPAPCYDIAPYPVWNSLPNAQWVSPFQNSAYIINNWPPSLGAWEFQNCFCVCRETTVNISFDMLVDDGAEILLDGTSIATAFSGYQFWLVNKLSFNQSFTLAPGRHCLSVKLYNSGAVAMGFALEGTVSGADLLTSSCCSPYASICGTKLQDVNCDGTVNPTYDPGLPGWTIELYDNLGNLIATAVTDNVGDYCFTGLHPGTYIVKEVMQAGWTQTVPGTGSYTVTVNAGDVGHAVFGNCKTPEPPPCDFRLDFDGSVQACGINMLAGVSGVPAGYQVASYAWTFGDGSGGSSANGIHYYTAPGTYTVCLTVTIFNGEQCCTKTVCKDIKIEKPCDGGCHFEASESITFNPDNCTYTFNAYVTYAGSPITGWLWDYGDGTTGLGSTTTHQYAHAGNYTVCLYLFSQQGDQCCFSKFCRDMTVRDCKEKSLTQNTIQAGPTKVADQANTNMIIMDQNAPNPFAENTVINYEIPGSFGKAEISITDLNGTVIKTFSITTKGKGQLTVFGNNLRNGMYMYSLIVDGKRIVSKRMVKN